VELTYPEVGATRGQNLPDGYRHVRRRVRLGTGEAVFRAAVTAMANWDIQRTSGLRVRADGPAAVGVRMTVGIGFWPLRIWAPCQVVWVSEEPARYGFGFGTLTPHPERGEEAFEVWLDESDEVWFDLRAFSRPATWYARLGRPFTQWLQDFVTDRYVSSLRRLATAG
jgi:uncharacterized protein (UPF0548 family)